jgi:hypothetical protein
MYKLEKYEAEMSSLFKSYVWKTSLEEAIYDYYQKIKPVDLTESFLYQFFVLIMRNTGYNLYDKMRDEFPDFTDAHLHTLLRHSFYAAFHQTVREIYMSEVSSHSFNLRDF